MQFDTGWVATMDASTTGEGSFGEDPPWLVHEADTRARDRCFFLDCIPRRRRRRPPVGPSKARRMLLCHCADGGAGLLPCSVVSAAGVPTDFQQLTTAFVGDKG